VTGGVVPPVPGSAGGGVVVAVGGATVAAGGTYVPAPGVGVSSGVPVPSPPSFLGSGSIFNRACMNVFQIAAG
jgi:hypothetical protein